MREGGHMCADSGDRVCSTRGVACLQPASGVWLGRHGQRGGGARHSKGRSGGMGRGWTAMERGGAAQPGQGLGSICPKACVNSRVHAWSVACVHTHACKLRLRPCMQCRPAVLSHLPQPSAPCYAHSCAAAAAAAHALPLRCSRRQAMSRQRQQQVMVLNVVMASRRSCYPPTCVSFDKHAARRRSKLGVAILSPAPRLAPDEVLSRKGRQPVPWPRTSRADAGSRRRPGRRLNVARGDECPSSSKRMRYLGPEESLSCGTRQDVAAL